MIPPQDPPTTDFDFDSDADYVEWMDDREVKENL